MTIYQLFNLELLFLYLICLSILFYYKIIIIILFMLFPNFYLVMNIGIRNYLLLNYPKIINHLKVYPIKTKMSYTLNLSLSYANILIYSLSYI